MRARAVTASCAVAALVAAAPAAAGDLALRVTPERLVLGPDARAVIELAGAGDAPPRLTVNVGRVEGPRPAGAGRFVAEYVAPPEQYPQVAIVAANAGESWGWTALPLTGRGLATARSAPHARISVTIGEASFGPVTADASGEARVPVVAPPGARFAYHRGRPLDLNVPPVLHVHLALGSAEVAADAPRDLPLRAFVVAPDGAPRAGAPLRLEVSEGRVVGLAEVAPGSWAGTWRLAPGRAGVARASAALADEPGLAASVQLARRTGALARLTVQAAEARVAADGAVLLRVEASDAAGNAVEASPAVQATLGELSGLVPVAPGAWETRLSVPGRVGSVRRLQVLARAGAVEGRAELEVAGGPPVELEVVAEEAPLVADGRAAARVRVRLRDRFGNPAEGAAPEIASARPAVVETQPDGPGAWVVRYRPRRAREDRADVLSVRAGGLMGAARLTIVAPERRLGVAPKLGVAAASGLLAPYAAVEAGYRTTLFAGRLAVAGEAGAFVHERTDTAQVGGGAVEVRGRARYLPALFTVRWEQRLAGGQALWAGAGAGVAHVASEVSTDAGPTSAEAGLVTLLHAGGGWGLLRRHGGPFLEARVARMSDPRFDALRGSLTTLLAVVGYRHDAY
ncbi:hypothetical protein [Anaeromyxobacter sp. SG66]|uniref:hypothetical protein n=1 Tax=Anaeromyxobacter sp. SG66 TaxID=2925410 RepID=UPI001F59516F|nr:hypothetical protein [Anaeromyxobacter sp. SG66]